MEEKNGWRFEGIFSVAEIKEKFVVLHRTGNSIIDISVSQDKLIFQEGEKKYAMHLIAERNKNVVNSLKNSQIWICDICNEDFFTRYGVKYVEAHHKIPMSTYSSSYVISFSDFALLCPNCHKAVHIYMKEKSYDYLEIKNIFKSKFQLME
jgi:putative restriction endonuclease